MTSNELIKLPKPNTKGDVSVEEVLQKRRSIRSYAPEGITSKQISQILWAAYGTTSGVKKTCPSAGATYPLEIYLLASQIEGLPAGFYRYNSSEHALVLVSGNNYRERLADVALNQSSIKSAPATIVIAARFERTTVRYGTRGERYVHIEVGHCAQNIYLQCEALRLATVAVGAYDDSKVKNLLKIPEEPLYIMPIGKKP